MISLKAFEELSQLEIQQFEVFLMRAHEKTANPANVNMWDVDWKSKANTLPYKLYVEGTFNDPKGVLFIAFDEGNIIGCSGAYVSEFDTQLLIAGVRTWISNDYRNLQIPREYFLPAQKQWAIDRKINAIALSFNEYNKNIITAFNRKRLGEVRSKREPHHMFYNGVNEVPFPVTIQHTKQYVIYEKLTDWDFDWESIRYNQD